MYQKIAIYSEENESWEAYLDGRFIGYFATERGAKQELDALEYELRTGEYLVFQQKAI